MPELTLNWALQPQGARLQPCAEDALPWCVTTGAFGRADALAWAQGSWTVAPRAAEPSADHLADAAMHGVRNSLSAILLGTELLARREPVAGSADMSGVLEHIAHAAARAHEQAEELADLGRLAAGRPICVAMRALSLHSTVAQVLSDVLSDAHAGAIEHDRLGQGDCHGDATRIAQFVRFALEEVGAMQTGALHRLVVSEVSGPRFRIAVHGTAPASGAASVACRLASASRRARMRGIAHVHRGSVTFGPALAGTVATIEGCFGSPGP